MSQAHAAEAERITRERLAALNKIRRERVISYHRAVSDLLAHIDAEVPEPAAPLIQACDVAREAFVNVDCAIQAEQFQLDMIGLLGRRGDELPKAAEGGAP